MAGALEWCHKGRMKESKTTLRCGGRNDKGETMIEFRERTLLETLKRLWPPHRRREDARMKEAIRQLVMNPDAPCTIDGKFIPDGYGGYEMRLPFDKL
jgi:hypothetical protein